MNKEKLYEWINKNYRRSTQPLYAWVDAVDLLTFIKEQESPTQPTQEKEEFCQLDESGLCENHVDKSFASESKPTQDTESWEEEFDDRFDFFECAALNGVEIKDFIKQKKNEWEISLAKSYEASKQALLAQHNDACARARTQGAEAAVEKLWKPILNIIENITYSGDRASVIKDSTFFKVLELLQQARKI